MTFKEFATLVRDLRARQRAFFLDRRPDDLEASKRLERKVDGAIRDIFDDRPSLFDGMEGEK